VTLIPGGDAQGCMGCPPLRWLLASRDPEVEERCMRADAPVDATSRAGYSLVQFCSCTLPKNEESKLEQGSETVDR